MFLSRRDVGQRRIQLARSNRRVKSCVTESTGEGETDWETGVEPIADAT
jgi:hypothetical protein